jgi:hypothetical protein
VNDSIRVPKVFSFADRSPMSTLQALKPLIVRPSLLPFVLLAIGLSAGAAWAQQPSTEGANLFAPSPQLGKTVGAERALPITSFYSHIEPKSGADPGTLLRSEPATDCGLPPGITATRILYYTRTASGKDALASGVVLVPYGPSPKGGWPLLAWSHGTSGVARSCAPSLMKSLFYNWEGLYEYVLMVTPWLARITLALERKAATPISTC